jgi:hypothetical protein
MGAAKSRRKPGLHHPSLALALLHWRCLTTSKALVSNPQRDAVRGQGLHDRFEREGDPILCRPAALASRAVLPRLCVLSRLLAALAYLRGKAER